MTSPAMPAASSSASRCFGSQLRCTPPRSTGAEAKNRWRIDAPNGSRARPPIWAVIVDPSVAAFAGASVGATGPAGRGDAMAAVPRPDTAEDMEQVVQRANDRYGSVDIIVHSSSGSGSHPAWGEFNELSVDQMMQCVNGMLVPVLLGTRLVINPM